MTGSKNQRAGIDRLPVAEENDLMLVEGLMQVLHLRVGQRLRQIDTGNLSPEVRVQTFGLKA